MAALVAFSVTANAQTLPMDAAPFLEGGGCGGVSTPTPTPEPTASPTPTPNTPTPSVSSLPASPAPMGCLSNRAPLVKVPEYINKEIAVLGIKNRVSITAKHSFYATQPGTYYYSPIGGYLSEGKGCTPDGKYVLQVTTFNTDKAKACALNYWFSSLMAGKWFTDYSGVCN